MLDWGLLHLPALERLIFKEIKGTELANEYRCSFVELNPATLVVAFIRNSMVGILAIGISSGQVIELPLDLIDMGRGVLRRVSNSKFVITSATSTAPPGL